MSREDFIIPEQEHLNQNNRNRLYREFHLENEDEPDQELVQIERDDFSDLEDSHQREAIGKLKYRLSETLEAVSTLGFEKLIEPLIDYGAETDLIQSNTGLYSTPLLLATEKGHLNIVKILLQRGANPNQQNYYHNTALHIAAYKNYYQICQILLQYKADPNIVNTYSETPLCISGGNKNQMIVELLIEHGAKIDIKDNNGNTILMNLCQKYTIKTYSEQQKTFRFLVEEMQVDIHQLNNQGNSVFGMADKKDRMDIISYLINQVISSLSYDKPTWSIEDLIIYASEHCDVDLVNLVKNKKYQYLFK